MTSTIQVKHDVLIAGAGPSGLVAALTLLQNGVSVRIIDKERKFRLGQRGCSVQPRTLETYKFLGILDDIQSLALPVQSLRQYRESPKGDEEVITFEMTETMENTTAIPYINLHMLGQDRHEQILREHLELKYGCVVELGTEFKSFEYEFDRVIAELAFDTPDGETITEKTRFKWVIGADGAHSTVRKQLGLGFMGETRALEAITVGDIHVKANLDRKYWHIWGAHADAQFSLRPFEDGDGCNFFISGLKVDHAKIAEDRDELIRLFYRVTGLTKVEFGPLVWAATWKPNIRMAYRFGKDRTYIVGDAAHVHSPTGGQGLNAGISDSFNLAWKLALVHKGLAPWSLLESYAEERIPVIATMLHISTDLLQKSFKVNDTNISEGWVRGFELRQLGVNYRGSSVVVDQKHLDGTESVDPYRSGNDGSVKAGDRAPDAPGLTSVSHDGTEPFQARLFDLFKPTHHTVLIFSSPGEWAATVMRTLSSYPEGTLKTVIIFPQTATSSSKSDDLVLVDSEGHAYRNYSLTETDWIVIVRPDGYIGGLVRDVDGMKAYFKSILL